jgi:uncharacterized repeat protein (TIGR03803 family)
MPINRTCRFAVKCSSCWREHFFRITKKPDGVWARKTLYSFPGGANSVFPQGALVLDAAGNLYGTTFFGGAYNQGSVFELSSRGDGSWTKTDLHSFAGYPDGSGPATGVIFDSAGNLYGTTFYGGARGRILPFGGTIFELTPQEGGGWKESIIHSFANAGFVSGLTMDRDGNLYGTTHVTNQLFGVVFELSPGSGGAWSYTILHTFPGLGDKGTNPSGDGAGATGVILDADGNLYGTTLYGGAYNRGTVFEVPAGQGPNGPDKILYSFFNSGGLWPLGGLVFDASGNLYGTTEYGGTYGGGKVFEMLPNGDGTWKEKTLHNFGGFAYNGFPAIDGKYPDASMIFGPDGNLYGVTAMGGYQPAYPNSWGGTVFRLNLH